MVLLSTAYLPPIAYFSAIKSTDNGFILEAFENFQKRSYRNRAFISSTNKVLSLSIPLNKGKNSQQPIRKVEISYDDNWHKNHLETFIAAYGKSAYFEHYFEEFRNIINKKHQFLFDLNLDLIKFILPILYLDQEILLTDKFKSINGQSIKSSETIIPLRTKQLLLSLEKEQKYYPQVFEDKFGFIPDLSIIDLIFCMGPEAGLLI